MCLLRKLLESHFLELDGIKGTKLDERSDLHGELPPANE